MVPWDSLFVPPLSLPRCHGAGPGAISVYLMALLSISISDGILGNFNNRAFISVN